jgi:type III restriction enzyme
MPGDSQIISLDDLVLAPSQWDLTKWREDRYEPFLDALCGDREYQKEAIRATLRYALGGGYASLRDLARDNWRTNDALHDRYGSLDVFETHLQLPTQLSGSIDLATGTGKSYVIYGTALILLAEGAVDRVLVLCPSTTIEAGLLKKFRLLAASSDLRESLPADAVLTAPRIIDAKHSITAGTLCVENRDAVYAHVRTSIRDSLWGEGASVAVLNDEAHHIANAPTHASNRWKAFLEDPAFGFRFVLGYSGTCYVNNEYFSDVLYRYSLRRAIEDGVVKSVRYVAESQGSGEDDERWQLISNRHELIRDRLQHRGIRPLTIVITPTIARCKAVGHELKVFLAERANLTTAQADERVLIVYNGAPDLLRMADVDSDDSLMEWIVSVSMLTEGWDVKRVFQIVPHEERAFNSKLLIAQVLGRGLRMPEPWSGAQPEVTVFNHAAWANRIRHLVNAVLENERRVTSKVLGGSTFHFLFHNLTYELIKETEARERTAPYEALSKGYVDIPTESSAVALTVKFETARPSRDESWETTIKRRTFTPAQVAAQMFNTLETLDLESAEVDAIDQQTRYAKEHSVASLQTLIEESLRRSGHTEMLVTEANRQKFLQALGTLRRRTTKVVRYRLDPAQVIPVDTHDRPSESATAAQLRRDQVAFIPPGARESLEPEQRGFFDEIVEPGGDYKCVVLKNRNEFRAPLNLAVADAANERRFMLELTKPANLANIAAWIKSTDRGFYSIDYAWKQGEHQKRSRFNPDFFLRIGESIVVVEIKDNEEVREPSVENVKKYEYARAHFSRLEDELVAVGQRTRYHFHFLAPNDFPEFFLHVRTSALEGYRSKLDHALSEAGSSASRAANGKP